MAEGDISVFPITELEVRIVASEQAVILRLPFLSHALQAIEEADPGRNYMLTLKQAIACRDALSRAILHLETAGAQLPSSPKH